MAGKILSKNQYQDIMQHPEHYLTNQGLRNCIVEKDLNGFPKVSTGGLAITYKVSVNGKNMALRCFHKQSDNRELHYKSISKFLSQTSSPYLLKINYQADGISYQHDYYPITTMDWIEGETLGTYVYSNINKPNKIFDLIGRFLALVQELSRLGIAHGDLSHTNIMVRNGELILIDYDGMYVPSLRGFQSIELGNSAFQHPGRTGKHFSSNLDAFSEIVIFLALKALSESPKLYDLYGKGKEGLFFQRSDFIDPDNSEVIKELLKIPGLSNLAHNFVAICKSDIANVPTLNEFISKSKTQISLPQSYYTFSLKQSDYPINANNREELINREGDNLVVIGKIDKYHRGVAINSKPYVFLNVGFFPNQTFTIVLWSDVLNLFDNASVSPSDFEDEWFSVTGTIDIYDNKPQIILESPADIAIISYEDAKRRLYPSYNKREGATSTVYSPPIVESPRLTSSNTSNKGAFANRDTNDVLRDYLSSINRQPDRSSEPSSGTIISQPPKPSQTLNEKSTIPDSGGSIEQRFEKGSVKPTNKDIESTDAASFSQIKKAIGNAFSQIPGLFQKTKSSNDKEVTNRDNSNITNKPPTTVPNSLSGKPNTTPPRVIPRTTIKSKSQAAKLIKLPTDIVNSKINHKIFGEGIIIGIRGDIIEVSFSCGNKLFEYPKAFLDGFLSLIDQDK